MRLRDKQYAEVGQARRFWHWPQALIDPYLF